ncbi:MBL fold metallo-hydrolase [Paenibacillus sp. HJGM_3]|uniref:MBL fold metallo-hydrolase n=1 Tax=Paenibacillus sp. HJGM_3 TaxID=3379816 RepID=UPI00385BD17A
MKLTNHVYAIGGGSLGYGLSSDYDCNVYAVDTGEELVLIDAGSGIEPERILDVMREDGLRIERVGKVLLTHAHADHAGGAAYWRRACGAEIFASVLTAEMVETGDEIRTALASARESGTYPASYRLEPCTVDVKLRPGDSIRSGGLSFRSIAAPGHSFDMVIYFCPELRALFAADAVFGMDGKLAVLRTPDFSLEQYRDTIAALVRLDVVQLFPGHGAALTEHGHLPLAAAHRRFELGLPPLSIV